jgi:hypothetical protein
MTAGQLSKILPKADKWLLPSSAFIYLLSLFFPGACGPLTSPDASWELVLHSAFSRHLQFGRDIVFTFGPWGFLYGGYYPTTFLISALAWTMLAFVFWWAGWRVANHFSSSRLFAWLWFIGFAGIAGMWIDQSFDVRMTGWALLLLFLHFFVEEGRISALQILLVFASGMLALVKFTALIEIAVVVGVIAADDAFRRRRFPWVSILFPSSILFFWILAGQQLGLLWPFLRHSWALAGGYTEAMTWNMPEEIEVVIFTLLAMAALFALTSYAAWEKCRFSAIFPATGLGAILLLSFKHGYVRYDQIHEVTAVLELLLVTLGCQAVIWPVLHKKSWGARAVNFVTLAVIYLFCSFTFNRCYSEQNFPDERLWEHFAQTLNIKNILMPATLLGNPEHLRDIYAENLAEVRGKFPMPPVEGTVDVYPWKIAGLFSRNMQYDPRPVIQSYSAYTPELAELNAGHLRSDHAPENILFDIDPMDAKFPSLEDGLSWPELLTRYDISDTTGAFLLLKRAATPRQHRLTPLDEATIHFGQTFALPAMTNAPLWAEMEINKSILGNLASIFYKPSILRLRISLRNGRQLFYYRLVPGMMRGGFLLSPLINDKKSFVALATNYWHGLAGLDVTAINISVATKSGSTFCYQPTIKLRLYRLDFPPQDLIDTNAEPDKTR